MTKYLRLGHQDETMVNDPPTYNNAITAGAPPPPGFVPTPSTHNATIIVSGPPQGSFGPRSKMTVCPYCNSHISSKVVSNATTKTHLIALLLCLGLCWCCVCLPYCMDSCRNQNHYCPNCEVFLGTYTN
ncbi:lipopolysaccharide-induced tumor necrosis factor-alpha factor [Agrilus planipennis]|uniref:Lipopolysaccharide-induced tumor necrosis factor-alpha factor n=1 Tax=Agrilus planipennis TaxID=224129 RepID=A0A1W4XWK1_AGRPL|nr:lipopolysaccharide-induced tumor necrosis factor-alpha factor [Agrilus planipennis]